MSEQYKVRMGQDGPTFHCEGDDTLLRAGLRHGLGLAYECNAGACGSCKFELIEGTVVDLFPDAPGLRPKERERGKRLACQCVPTSDCTIKMRAGDEFVSTVRPRRFQAKLTAREMLTPDIARFVFKAPGPAQFLPGQYALLSLSGATAPRAYSMSNVTNEHGNWEFIIRRVPGGAVSEALFDSLRVGDSVGMDGPYGIAYLRTDNSRPIVGIAGGSGLAPVLSVVRGAALLKWQRPPPTLLYGGRGPADIPDVPATLAAENIRANFRPVVSDPDLAKNAAWPGDVGFVHNFITDSLTGDPADHEYYLAGPPPMIEAAVRLLAAELRVPASQIHYDRFF